MNFSRLWHPPRAGDETRLIAAIVVLVPAVVLVVTAVVEALRVHQFTWLPGPVTPAANFLLAGAIPAALVGAWAAMRRSSLNKMSAILLAACMFAPVLTALCGILSADSGIGAVSFYLLGTVPVAYLWRRRTSVVQLTLSISASLVHFLWLDPVHLALTKWVGISVLMVGVTQAFSISRTKQHMYEQELKAQIRQDNLTGLASRQHLAERIAQVRESSPTGAGHAFIVLDLDGFKQVNDNHGHASGDEVLRRVAQKLQNCVRSTDVACRLGGDELAVFLPNTTLQVAQGRAAEIDVVISQTSIRLLNGDVISMQASIGLAHATSAELDLEQLYIVADRRLYAAKRRSRSAQSAVNSPPKVSGESSC